MTVDMQFLELFRGRGDAYGSWEGGCVREGVRAHHFGMHLHDGPYIGIYPSLPFQGNPMCVWGCTDIDKTDDPSQAFLLASTFKAVDVAAHVERTAHGYHIWVFAERLVSAQSMRHMFLAAHQVADIPPKEVNPKQTDASLDKLGNYVRLPYPGALSGGSDVPLGRHMINSRGDIIGLEDFVEHAHANRTPLERIEFLAGHYVPPPQPRFDVAAPSGELNEITKSLTPLGFVIFRDGPLEGRDRSGTLQHLGHECRKGQLNPADALLILKDADLRWGKYSARADGGLAELTKIVERAYGQ